MSSPASRRALFFKLWDSAYNEEGIRNFILYYMDVFVADFFDANDLSKKECINILLSWGVPFVPYPTWCAFIISQPFLQNCGKFSVSRLEAARLKFFVSRALLVDSRSKLQVAIDGSGGSLDETTVTNYTNAAAAEKMYVKLLSNSSSSRQHSPRLSVASLPSDSALADVKEKLTSRALSQRRESIDDAGSDISSSTSESSSDSSTDDSSSVSSSDSSSMSDSELSVGSCDSSNHFSNEKRLRDVLRKKISSSKASKRRHAKSPPRKSDKKAMKAKKAKKSHKSKKKSKKSKSARKAKKEGHQHYHQTVSDLDNTIKRGGFIDFFAYTPARLDLLKQLGTTTKHSTLVPGSNFWISTSSPNVPDPALVVRSKANLSAGFYFYLSRLNVVKREHLVTDRVLWWSWLNTKFPENDHALLFFACNFILKHHGTKDWAPAAENAHQLYVDALRCSDASTASTTTTTRDERRKPVLVAKKKHIIKWTPAQQVAVQALRSKCPPKTCLSRIIKNFACGALARGQTCKFLHVCGWCKSASCVAACAQTPPSPL
jgi:hypothetical protein